MKTNFLSFMLIASVVILVAACNTPAKKEEVKEKELTEMQKLLANYAEVELTADLSHLSANEKELIKKLIEVSKIMDELFWRDAIGDKEAFLTSIEDEDAKKYAMINYGPWDRLDGNIPFIESYGEKTPGANYYPQDITKKNSKHLLILIKIAGTLLFAATKKAI
jgi:hypothetical protein